MLINIVVTWHDHHKIKPNRSEVVQVHERDNNEDYFLNGLMNQAMRQDGYSEEEILLQAYMGPVEFSYPNRSVRLKKVCDECGGTDVCIDAWAAWSECEQDWVLANMYEAAFCNDCEQECNIEDKEIEP